MSFQYFVHAKTWHSKLPSTLEEDSTVVSDGNQFLMSFSRASME